MLPGWAPSEDAQLDFTEDERRARFASADHRLGSHAAHINAAWAEALEALYEVDRLGGWNDHGATSCEEWFGWRCGLPIHEARRAVRTARRLPNLPLIRKHFGAGELSYWQVATMVQVATPEIEESLVEIALYSTATQLARVVRAFKGVLDRIELDRSNARHVARSLVYHYDEDGFLVMRAKLTPEDGAVLLAALNEAAKEIEAQARADTDEAESAEPDTIEARRADVLLAMARRSLDAGDAPERSTVQPVGLVHVDVPSLIDGSGERCELEDGPVLASETARRMLCDATVQAVFERDGEVFDLGRTRRTVPPRLRRALEQRDVTCRFPGCDRKRFREGHHIVFWSHNGKTALSNLVLLCHHHHRLVHEGRYRIEGHPSGELTFIAPSGRIVPRSPERPSGDPTELVREHEKRQLSIDDRTATSKWDGKQIDYGDCVHALLQAGGLLEMPPRGP